jgi:hypothetical protein
MEKEKIQTKEENNTLKGVPLPVIKRIMHNVLIAVFVMAYFIILNMAYQVMNWDRLKNDIYVFAGAFLICGIVFIEQSYKKDNTSKMIHGIELLAMSYHTLSINYVITRFNYSFQNYLLTASYIIAIYFVFKAIVIYTRGRRAYLKEFDDISEIVKKDEPSKKEAKKRNREFEEENVKIKKNKEQKVEVKKSKIHEKNVKVDEKQVKNKNLKETKIKDKEVIKKEKNKKEMREKIIEEIEAENGKQKINEKKVSKPKSTKVGRKKKIENNEEKA